MAHPFGMDPGLARQSRASYDLRGVFAVGSGDVAVARAVAERLAVRYEVTLVDRDGWLRLFAAHAASRGVIPEIGWEARRAAESFAMRSSADARREGDGRGLPEAALDRWRAVPWLAAMADGEAQAATKLALDRRGACVLFGRAADIEPGDHTRKALLLASDGELEGYLAKPRDPVAAERAKQREFVVDARGVHPDCLADALEGFHARSVLDRRREREARDLARRHAADARTLEAADRRAEAEEDARAAAAYERDHRVGADAERGLAG